MRFIAENDMSTLAFVVVMLVYVLFADRGGGSCECEPREYTDQELGEGMHLRD